MASATRKMSYFSQGSNSEKASAAGDDLSSSQNSAGFKREPPHYHGLSICCYAPLQSCMEHYTCSDCSTVFNRRGVMTLKEETEYFETDISPYEQYRAMLNQERYQILSEQMKGFAKYQPESYYASSGARKRLVQMIFSLGQKLDQSKQTLHLAIRLLDRVFSLLGGNPADIAIDSYELITNGCMLLAAKFEELDMKIPLIQDLQVASRFKLGYQQLRGVQNELLTLLDFDLMALTPYHVISQLFATGLILSNDSKRLSDKDITERTLVKVREYTQFFCDIAAEHYHISCKYPPSKVGNACFYLARKCCNLRAVWSFDLEEYTGYTEADMRDIVKDMTERCAEIKGIIEYARNNCREGPRAEYINNLKYQFKGPMIGRQRWNIEKPTESKWVEHSYNVFDSFLRARGISDPYQSCALQQPKKAALPTRTLEALTLHEAQAVSENHRQPARVQEEVVAEEAIFSELSTAASNTVIREVIMPTPKKGTMDGKQTTEYEAGPQQTSSNDRREKENWDELTEKIQSKRKELSIKKGAKGKNRESTQNNLLIR